MQKKFIYQDKPYSVGVQHNPPGYDVMVNDAHYDVAITHSRPGEISFNINGHQYHAFVSSDKTGVWVAFNGHIYHLETRDQKPRKSSKNTPVSKENILYAPMPGNVRDILVNVGEAVSTGHTLMLIEAMKMEMRIQAPKDGTIKQLMVKHGELVQKDQPLIELE